MVQAQTGSQEASSSGASLMLHCSAQCAWGVGFGGEDAHVMRTCAGPYGHCAAACVHLMLQRFVHVSFSYVYAALERYEDTAALVSAGRGSC